MHRISELGARLTCAVLFLVLAATAPRRSGF